METLDATASRVADTRDARSVEGGVLVVDLLDGRFADYISCPPDSAGRLHARDGGDQARAGDPEARRHLALPLVLDNARRSERAAGSDAERTRLAAELPCNSIVVS